MNSNFVYIIWRHFSEGKASLHISLATKEDPTAGCRVPLTFKWSYDVFTQNQCDWNWQVATIELDHFPAHYKESLNEEIKALTKPVMDKMQEANIGQSSTPGTVINFLRSIGIELGTHIDDAYEDEACDEAYYFENEKEIEAKLDEQRVRDIANKVEYDGYLSYAEAQKGQFTRVIEGEELLFNIPARARILLREKFKLSQDIEPFTV
jgi:hypothetical protein